MHSRMTPRALLPNLLSFFFLSFCWMFLSRKSLNPSAHRKRLKLTIHTWEKSNLITVTCSKSHCYVTRTTIDKHNSAVILCLISSRSLCPLWPGSGWRLWRVQFTATGLLVPHETLGKENYNYIKKCTTHLVGFTAKVEVRSKESERNSPVSESWAMVLIML